MGLEPKYNVLAIISLVTAFFISLAAIITGHLALSQIKKSGEKGRGLALAGVILGYVGFVATIVSVVVLIVVGAAASSAAKDAAGINPGATVTQTAPAETTDPQPSAAAGPVSKEFCDVVAAMTVKSKTAASEDQKKALILDMYKQLSEVSGPNQETYVKVYGVLSSPQAQMSQADRANDPQAAEMQVIMDESEPLIKSDAAECKAMAAGQ
ncbi:UNVERIFIED_ORG: hypothetical protein ABIB52_000816 [Arthrobacter sp. UYCu721]